MLAIVGGKGGCGKTTTALGLALAFGASGDRSLVVEADIDMPNLHTRAGTSLTPGLDAVADGEPPHAVAHRSEDFPNVDVLPAGRVAGTIPQTTLTRLGRARRRVLVDCPASATEAVATPVRAADEAVVVSTTDRGSRVDAAKTARMVESLDTRLLGAVVTRTSHGRASVPARGPLRSQCEVLGTVPEIDGRGATVLRDPVGRSSYERIARRLSERNI